MVEVALKRFYQLLQGLFDLRLNLIKLVQLDFYRSPRPDCDKMLG
jgi:hypothetical protein